MRPLLSPRYNKRPHKSGFELQETHFAALRSGIPGVEVLRSVDLLGQEFTLPAGGAEKQYVLDGCDDVETDEVDLDQLRSWVIDRRSIHQVQVPR